MENFSCFNSLQDSYFPYRHYNMIPFIICWPLLVENAGVNIVDESLEIKLFVYFAFKTITLKPAYVMPKQHLWNHIKYKLPWINWALLLMEYSHLPLQQSSAVFSKFNLLHWLEIEMCAYKAFINVWITIKWDGN